VSGDGDSSLTQGFVGPAILTSCRSCRDHDGGAVLVGVTPQNFKFLNVTKIH
jgi:hypothetical protein